MVNIDEYNMKRTRCYWA